MIRAFIFFVDQPTYGKFADFGPLGTIIREFTNDVEEAGFEYAQDSGWEWDGVEQFTRFFYDAKSKAQATINFNLPWEAPIKIEVYNDQGQLVVTLIDNYMGPGNFSVTWDGKDSNGAQVASGVYIYKIKSLDLNLSKKVTFLK